MNKLESYVSFLATTASMAPFIGLFGTVVGIMNAFEQIGVTGSTSLQAVGGPIAEALVATAAGLAAAIPAVLFYNYLSGRVKLFASEMDDFAMEFLNICERNFTLDAEAGAGGQQRVRPQPGAAAASRTSLAEINVVPLVDVMLVLLIIFMVAAPMIQRGIDVKLPQSRRATSVTGERVEITHARHDPPVAASCSSASEQVKLERPAGARPPEDGDQRQQGSVPARRRERAVSGSDERDRRAEGGRRAEHRHGRQDAERALMDVTDVLRDRMQTPGGPAEDDLACRSRCTSLLAAALIVVARRLAAGATTRRRR